MTITLDELFHKIIEALKDEPKPKTVTPYPVIRIITDPIRNKTQK